ncbi:hypothetical protein SAV14893_013290 [Streptomyces avermitilis]|uniref:Uncharacterized protein n=1 Tax=Streptomyces avermitilis TaxID=33903 RepID=A0A4D4LRE5_STRAX|nr:hypothetical protein SAV14893_013290 [Streptomyces avermitilis]
MRRAAYKVVTHELATEVDRLTRAASRLCATSPDPALRDHAPWALRTALQELLVRLEVYRPYASGDAAAVVTEEAAAEARAVFTVPEEAGAVSVVRDLALGRAGDGPGHLEFRARFAQTSSALRAKSVEDTGFYRYVPLLSANEVGGNPGSPAVSPRTSTRTARACSATGPRPAPLCRRTTRSAAPTCARPSPCSPSARSAGPTRSRR